MTNDADTPVRYCGIDYGAKRVGLAISDPGSGMAFPLTTLQVSGGRDDQIAAIVKATAEEEVDEWVVGLPLNMDGTEGPQARTTRNFAERLAQVTGQRVHLIDERLSSQLADEYLREAELTNKKHKARRDRVAAQIILRTFLEQRSGDEG